MRVVSIEEHFVTESFLRATGMDKANVPPRMAALQPQLLDLDARRIADKGEAGIDYQVLSLSSMGFDTLNVGTAVPLVRDINHQLTDAIRSHPARLGGFATLALKDPTGAAIELERCVSRLDFYGTLVDGMMAGLLLEGQFAKYYSRHKPSWISFTFENLPKRNIEADGK